MARSIVKRDAVRYWDSPYHNVIGGCGAVGVHAQALVLVPCQALPPLIWMQMCCGQVGAIAHWQLQQTEPSTQRCLPQRHNLSIAWVTCDTLGVSPGTGATHLSCRKLALRYAPPVVRS